MDPNTWKPIDSYREMKLLAGGKVLVVRPSDKSTVVPLFCPLCKFPMRTADDSISYRKSQCCENCFLFCRGNREEMRPESWEEYLSNRQIAAKRLINIK